MNRGVDMITANTQLVVEELVENDLLADDLLDREEFIDQVFDIIQLFSKQSEPSRALILPVHKSEMKIIYTEDMLCLSTKPRTRHIG